MVYFLILLLILIFIIRYDFNDNCYNKKFSYRLLLCLLILVSGLRYRVGADTKNYIYTFYHGVPALWDLSFDELFSHAFDPLFLVITSIVKSFGGKFYIVQLIQAIFVNSLIFLYISKHSKYIFTCVFVYFLWCYPIYNFEEMRASMAISMCLFANDYAQEKKWVKSILIYAVASLFHFSTALLLATPFLLFLKFNKIGWSILVLSYMLGYTIQQNFSNYIELFQFNQQIGHKAELYSSHEVLFKENITILGIFAKKISLIAYSYFSYLYIKFKSKQNDLQILNLQPFVIIGLLCVIFSIPMPIFYRFIHFYQIYFIFFFVHFFIDISKDNIHQMKSLSWVRALILFIPFFNVISYEYRYQFNYQRPVYFYSRFYPYASIFDKSLDEDREYFYKQWELGQHVRVEEY